MRKSLKPGGMCFGFMKGECTVDGSGVDGSGVEGSGVDGMASTVRCTLGAKSKLKG